MLVVVPDEVIDAAPVVGHRPRVADLAMKDELPASVGDGDPFVRHSSEVCTVLALVATATEGMLGCNRMRVVGTALVLYPPGTITTAQRTSFAASAEPEDMEQKIAAALAARTDRKSVV